MNVAFIPVRGGSKSIPLKNIKEIAGKPLVYWTAKAASECKCIDRVYISTDSEKIAEVVLGFNMDKVEVIGRSQENASDTATTESAMMEFAKKYNFSNIVLIQATSPLLQSEDLCKGLQMIENGECDSVISTVLQKRFYWAFDDKEEVYPLNYDMYNRPRRQDFDGCLVENGAFYITSRERFLLTGNRISGRIKAVRMREETYFEIDEPFDWDIIEHYIIQHQKKQIDTKSLNKIKMFLTDCDGCLTDGGMYYSEFGDELKKFNTLDGKGFELLREKGIICGIITGENVEIVRRRANKLNLDIVKMGVKDKMAEIQLLCKEYKIGLDNIAYVGDDVVDKDVICNVGFGCSVMNGMQEVKNVADYITSVPGGQGAIREIAELILKYKYMKK